MKIHNIILASIFLLASAAHVQAAPLNFSNYNYDMGTVAAGEHGKISTNDKIIPIRDIEAGTTSTTETGLQYDYVYGLLPINTKITFTFNAPFSLIKKDPHGNFAEGTGQVSDGTYIYRAWANTDNNWTYSEKAGPDGVFHETDSTLGLTVETSLTKVGRRSIATLIITNLSNIAANFESYFFSPTADASGAVRTSYRVEAIPLPAALPLFGLALAGFAGYSRRKKVA